VRRGDKKCFGDQMNLKGGNEKCFRIHLINERGNEKFTGDQVVLKNGDEKCSSTHFLGHDVME
jgi:hypothetical protein